MLTFDQQGRVAEISLQEPFELPEQAAIGRSREFLLTCYGASKRR